MEDVKKATDDLVVVCDLDGTLCNSYERFLSAGAEPSRDDPAAYHKWLDAVQNAESLLADEPIWPVWSMLQVLIRAGVPVVYLTSREERWRDVTSQWLKSYACPGALIMRPNGDWRSSGEFKGAIVKDMQERYPNLEILALDDDPRGDVAKQFRKQGVTLLRVMDCVMAEE